MQEKGHGTIWRTVLHQSLSAVTVYHQNVQRPFVSTAHVMSQAEHLPQALQAGWCSIDALLRGLGSKMACPPATAGYSPQKPIRTSAP